MKTNMTIKRAALLLTLSGMAALSMNARAQILWDNPAAMSGLQDIKTDGTIVKAYNIGERYDVTFPDIYFAPFQTATVDNYLSITSPTAIGQYGSYDNGLWDKGGEGNPFNPLERDYGFLGRGGIYAQTGQPLTLTLSNLTPGATYQVQVWINDTRAIGNTRSAYLLSPETDSLVSAAVGYNQGDTNTLGNYIIGTFIAGAGGVQEFDIISTAGGQINALVLSIIPEPSTWALLLTGAGLLAVVKRKRVA